MKKYSDTTLTISLGALQRNYKKLAGMTAGATAAVVKANAYGLGVDKCAPALYAAGCRDFFVATADEALQLVEILAPDARIYVFHGVKRNEAEVFAENNLIPVINNAAQLEAWGHQSRTDGLTLPAVLHFDTGMNRLGFGYNDAAEIAKSSELEFLDVKYVMSHLAVAEDTANPVNELQVERFAGVRKNFANAGGSLANSWGLIADKKFHHDLARPGCAMYGSRGGFDVEIEPVITLRGKILQLREVKEDGTVGYGCTHKVAAGTKLAVVPAGYADGYLRSLSNRSNGFYNGKLVPLVGIVSMDMTIFDVSGVEGIKEGDEIELIGSHYTVDDIALDAGSIAYEILTSLGSRYNRVYTD